MERYQNVEKVAVHDTDTCLFLASDGVTNVTLISESHGRRMGMLEQNENGHRMTATGFLMKLLNPSAKVTHFLFVSLFLRNTC